jgi:hypothetical protein
MPSDGHKCRGWGSFLEFVTIFEPEAANILPDSFLRSAQNS